jgi:hypothetical protein
MLTAERISKHDYASHKKRDIDLMNAKIAMQRYGQSVRRLAKLSDLWQRNLKTWTEKKSVRQGSTWHELHGNCRDKNSVRQVAAAESKSFTSTAQYTHLRSE